MSPISARPATNGSQILSSKWDGLSPHLIARFYPVRRLNAGSGWEQSRDKREISAADKFIVDDGYEVHAPLTEGNQEMTLNWQSPFENAGPESKAPALSAMLQTGQLGSTLQNIGGLVGVDIKNSRVDQALASAEGRTGITKLNSTQVFAGMPPIKRNLTLHFRALKDPVAEVQRPIQQLEEWAVPQYLAPDSIIAGVLANGDRGNPINSVFPSTCPQVLGMQYGGETLMPIVIESMEKLITTQRSDKGVPVACTLQMQIATLTALDRRDVQNIYF